MMALNDILNTIEQEIKFLKDKISETDFNEVKEKYQRFKEASLKLSVSLTDSLKEKLSDEDVQAKLAEYKENILNAMKEFSSFASQMNDKYQLSDNLGSAINQLSEKFVELQTTFQQNYGQQIHSTVEALSHGFKAWADAKPLDDDIQAIKSNIESNIQKLKTWIRKE
ncbi:MAG: hypothetical protein KGZ51_03795 [Erysipelothrix sp.]|nr:hypothetical protein [Erysipelothrix sp.]